MAEAKDGSCLTTEHVYSCSETETFVVSPAIAGTCEDETNGTEENEEGSGFSDAVAGLMAVGEGAKDFEEGELSIFEGETLKCGKWIFGAKNCCTLKGPLLFLGCDEAEDKLQTARNDNRCISVGSYCDKKALFGSCLKKKESYCCYTSEIAKIVAEAGKDQLNKDFGSPRSPTCDGFSVEEFQLLNLNNVDFSPVAASIINQMNIGDPGEIQDRLSDRIRQMQGGSGQ